MLMYSHQSRFNILQFKTKQNKNMTFKEFAKKNSQVILKMS